MLSLQQGPAHALASSVLRKTRLSDPRTDATRSLFLSLPQEYARGQNVAVYASSKGKSKRQEVEEKEEEVEWEEEEESQGRFEDVRDGLYSVVEAVPGPRVGGSDVPWLVAAPVGYLAVTFVIAVVRTVLKQRTPKAKRKRQIGKNALLCKEVDELLLPGREELGKAELQKLQKRVGFSSAEILRKYVRYALNERPFGPALVADLIHLRQLSALEDTDVSELLNDVGRRIVKAQGPVVMDTTGFTEKGLKRKAAVQALFTKLLYLAELDEVVSDPLAKEALQIKTIFGLTDEDADSIRITSLSSSEDMDALDRSLSSSSSSSSSSRKGNEAEEEKDDGADSDSE